MSLERRRFDARLGVALALTLLGVLALNYVLSVVDLRAGFVESLTVERRADVVVIEDIIDDPEGEPLVGELREILDFLRQDEGVEGVTLLAADGATVLGDAPLVAVGAPDIASLTSGEPRTWRVPEGDHDGFHTLARIGAGTSRYAALLVTQHGLQTREAQDALARRTVIALPVGLLLGIGLFLVAGGRSVRRRHQDALTRARLDSLTGLQHHGAFQSDLADAVTGRHADEGLCVLVLDIDDFKLVNDRRGHGEGDRLLRAVGDALTSAASQRVYRIGGDEFAVLLPGEDERLGLLEAQRLRVVLSEQLRELTCSVGVADTAGEPETVVQRADAAVREAKRAGRNLVLAYSQIDCPPPVVTPAVAEALTALLRDAAMGVAYQPILRGDGRGLVGVEALARPLGPGPLHNPEEVFAAAEALGHVADLDALCLRTALRGARELPAGALLFLNVSPDALGSAALLPAVLAAAVREAGLEPDRVVLEITERKVTNRTVVIREAGRLRDAGFLLALDDVGAGNAGLELLRTITVDYVKLDRSLVVDAVSDPRTAAVLRAVMVYAEVLGVGIIAEGIEDVATLRFLRRAGEEAGVGIDGLQGWLFARPRPSAGDVEGLVVPDAPLVDLAAVHAGM